MLPYSIHSLQDHESEMDSILDRRMRRLLYPEGHGYSCDTGGKLDAIRNLCSIDRVSVVKAGVLIILIFSS